MHTYLKRKTEKDSFADRIHNFIDGMLIAASFFLSYDLGVATTLAVIFHEIPQEIGDFGFLIYGGFTRRRLCLQFCFSLNCNRRRPHNLPSSVPSRRKILLGSICRSGFIYMAATDLMPELQKISCDRIHNPAIYYSGWNRVNVDSENIIIVNMLPEGWHMQVQTHFCTTFEAESLNVASTSSMVMLDSAVDSVKLMSFCDRKEIEI